MMTANSDVETNAPANPTDAQFVAYQRMWDFFNGALFDGALSKVLLNFSRRARSLGFFAPERWKNGGNQVAHEISLNPTYLQRDTARDVASTLVHEMVHLFQYEFGTPKRSGYHDAQWAAKMDEVGLTPSSTGAPGGRRVGYKMSHYIVEGGRFACAFAAMPTDYVLPWSCGIDEDAVTKGKRTKKEEAKAKLKLKYSCPSCALNVWGRAGLRLGCEDCDEELVADEPHTRDANERSAPERAAA